MRGIPGKLYVDNGPAFRSRHLQHTCASIGIALIYSRPYQPEGKGKIERWFRTVRESFLSTEKAKTLDDLNESFSNWIITYNHTQHSITKEEPIKRFASRIECIRAASGDMEDHFRRISGRTKGNDRTVQYSVFYGFQKEPFAQDIGVKDMIKSPSVIGAKKRFDFAVQLASIAVITGDIGGYLPDRITL